MKRLGGFVRDDAGASAVDFALLIGPLVMVLLGVCETGRFFFTSASLQSAVVQVSRCMGVRESACAPGGAYSAAQTQAYAQSLASTYGVTLTASQISLSNTATCGGVSGFSQATISYTFQTAVPLILPSLANGIPITGSACFPNQPG